MIQRDVKSGESLLFSSPQGCEQWLVNNKLVNHFFCNESSHISLLWYVVHFSLLWPQQ